MKRLIVRILWVGGLILVGVAPVAARNDFTGRWYGIDAGSDNSSLFLDTDGRGSTVHVSYHDKEATLACPRGGGEGYPAQFETTGGIRRNVLMLDAFQLECLSNPPSPGPRIDAGTYYFIYDPVTGTLTDSSGAVYTRGS